MPIMNFSIQWHITEFCPNTCLHCYMGMNPIEKHLSLFDFFSLLAKINVFEAQYKSQINNVSITGGDPLSNPDWYEICNALRQQGKQVRILGIPEQVTDSNCSKLKELGISMYQVSLDGLKETHDKIRGAGSFDRTVNAIKKLSANGIEVAIMFTMHNLNCSEMFDLIDFLDQLKVRLLFAFDFVVLSGNAVGKFSPLSALETQNILSAYLNKKHELYQRHSLVYLGEKSSFFNALKYQNIDVEKVYCEYPAVSGCGVGWNTLTILPDGEIYPCRRLPISLGNLFQTSFDDIFLLNPLLRKIRRRDYFEECGKCKHFLHCKGCPAVEFGISKNPFSKQKNCNFFCQTDLKQICNSPSLYCSKEEEFKFISNSMANQTIQTAFKSPEDAVRALLLLCDSKNEKMFFDDPQKWLRNNNFAFSKEEVDKLFFLHYEH